MGTSRIEEEDCRENGEESVEDLLDSDATYKTDLGAAFHGDSRELLKETSRQLHRSHRHLSTFRTAA